MKLKEAKRELVGFFLGGSLTRGLCYWEDTQSFVTSDALEHSQPVEMGKPSFLVHPRGERKGGRGLCSYLSGLVTHEQVWVLSYPLITDRMCYIIYVSVYIPYLLQMTFCSFNCSNFPQIWFFIIWLYCIANFFRRPEVSPSQPFSEKELCESQCAFLTAQAL